MPYVLLALAIVSEVTATISLKFSAGFSRLMPSLMAIGGYAVAFALLAWTLDRGLPVSVAYGTWAAAGVALVAIVGAVFLGERLTAVQVAGIGAVIVGVLALELGAEH